MMRYDDHDFGSDASEGYPLRYDLQSDDFRLKTLSV